MGLLDDAVGAVGGKGGSSNQVMGALGGLVEQAGGVQGILSKLEASGLGDRVQSWLGTGANKEISPDEAKQALGPEEVTRAADRAGVSEDEAAGGIAGMLPELIDRVSPGGKLPDVGPLDDMLAGFLKR
ncbi:MAG TPA: YidB family protein [Miltoncostaeaceae bacterium]|nr:YidB family protein [Miltoncostaeaceae bacterium]